MNVDIDISKETIDTIVQRTVEELKPFMASLPMPVMDVQEAADYLRISKQQVYRLVRTDNIPHFNVEKKIFFRLKDLNDWMINGGTGRWKGGTREIPLE